MADRLIESVYSWIQGLTDSSLNVVETNKEILITGSYSACYYYAGLEFSLQDKFDLEIHVYKDYPNKVPEIEEVSGKIPRDFHMNGRFFCLAVPIEMSLFAKKYLPGEFIRKYLDSYLMTYMCYKEYKFCPYGDRMHGIQGKIEHLQEYFGLTDVKNIIELLEVCVNSKIGRNDKCVCGKDNKYKFCHLNLVDELKTNIDRNELIMTLRELISYV